MASESAMDGTFDHQMMARALAEAERGRYTASPNPNVGCVLARSGRIIGVGYHHRAGGPHAEAAALADCARRGEDPRDATCYVTLEPCSHHGRTPPCADALVRVGVARVVCAQGDPDTRVSGRGFERLRAAGIEVEVGVGAVAARALHRGYIERVSSGRPFVTLKVAASLDGRTAMASGESKWITGPQARADVQQLRARSCALLTGIGTVLADAPQLNVRLQPPATIARQPMLAVLDSRGRLPHSGSWLFDDRQTVQYVNTQSLQSDRGQEPSALPASMTRVGVTGTADGLLLSEVLDDLGARGANDLLVEAGPTLVGAFFRSGLWHEAVIYLAPKLLGDRARPLAALGFDAMSEALACKIVATDMIGPDLRITVQKP